MIASIVDDGRFLEIHELWVQNMAVNILFRNDVKAAADPNARSQELAAEYQE